MKPRNLSFLLSILLIGCSSVNTTAYKSVGVTQVSVQTALDAWNQSIPVLKPSATEQRAVRNAFDTWKASMLVVCDVGAAYSAGVGSTNEYALNTALQYAISNSNQTKTDFLTLVTRLGVKLSP